MTVSTIFRRAAAPLAVFAILFAALAGCAKIRPITAPAPESGTADFSVYEAMGTSLTAGFQSGGLADRHQKNSFVNLFARQAGVTRFLYPGVNLGGWPPLLRVRSFQPLVLDSAGIRGAFPSALEATAKLDSAYNNMGIPGALLADVNDPFLNYNIGLGRDVTFFFHIARQQGRAIPLSILQLVRNARPTFVSFEYGVNELLGPATRGSGTPAVPAGAWAGLLHVTLDSLDINCPNAKKLIVNVPDPTKAPFFHILPPVELDRAGRPTAKFLIGVSPGDLLTLGAIDSLRAGYGYAIGDTSYLSGIPVPGNGLALPPQFVLDAGEVASIQTAAAAYNAAIAAEAAGRGYALLDFHALLDSWAATGVRIAGATYTTAYLTGGLFSVDGLHPTDLAHGLACNEMIRVVNAKFGSRIPQLDLSRVMTPSSSGLRRADGVIAAAP